MNILQYNIANRCFESRPHCLKAVVIKYFLKKSFFIAPKRSYSNNLESQTPFLLLKNLRKNNGKFRYLLKNIIAEKLFLIYAYKTMFIIPNYFIHLDFTDKIILKGVNVK